MKTKYKIIIGIILILILIYIIGINYQPQTITYKITGDFTSSGAQRNFEATITFADNELVTGNESYRVGQGGICTKDCNYEYKCMAFLKNTWVDSTNNSEPCKIENYVPNSIKQIEKKINSGEFKSIDNCNHGDLCYEIINYD